MDSIDRLAALIEQMGAVVTKFEQMYRSASFTEAMLDSMFARGYAAAQSDFPRRRRPWRRRGEDAPDLRVVR